MFEDYTYESMLEDVLENAPDGIDTRQGSIFYDAVSGILIKLAKLYTDLDLVLELTQLDTMTDEYLDIRASDFGMTRKPAIPAKYHVTFIGTVPEIGERFFAEDLYFVLGYDSVEGCYYLEAEEPGSGGNVIYTGTPAVPVGFINDLESATFGAVIAYGADAEEDDVFRARIRDKTSGPSENGNKAHYKTWCESIDGVSLARIIPLWNGPNTVRAVLLNARGQPCSASVVQAVQEYIDPASKGHTAVIEGKTYTVGDGLGEGVANLGAHFTASAAEELSISVAFSAQLKIGYSMEDAQTEVRSAIESYLTGLVLSANEAADIVVRLTAIGSIILAVESVVDYTALTLNGDTKNIVPEQGSVPVLVEVMIDALQ